VLDLDDEDTVGGLCRLKIEGHLWWYHSGGEKEGESAEGTLVINVAERTISISVTKDTMAVVTEPLNETYKIKPTKVEAAA